MNKLNDEYSLDTYVVTICRRPRNYIIDPSNILVTTKHSLFSAKQACTDGEIFLCKMCQARIL
jgi:hypothetical protein